MPVEADAYVIQRVREGEPCILDPSIAIRCKKRTLRLTRRSGGRPVFSFMTLAGDRIEYDEVTLDSEEKFIALWSILKTMKKKKGGD